MIGNTTYPKSTKELSKILTQHTSRRIEVVENTNRHEVSTTLVQIKKSLSNHPTMDVILIHK